MSKELVLKVTGYGTVIHYEGGGQVPDSLSGLYTSANEATQAISQYLTVKRVRKPTNAKSTAVSREK